jgi:hypothetical protein
MSSTNSNFNGVLPEEAFGQSLSSSCSAQRTASVTTAERGGVQPVVKTLANGGVRAEVKVGEPVRFTVHAEQPPGMGTIVAGEWDFEGRDRWKAVEGVDGTSSVLQNSVTYAYAKPGTYFASFRASGHRHGAAGLVPVLNNNRVRVVVS